MALWISAFEIPAILLFLFAVGLLIKRKDYNRLTNLITASLFGIILEYVNIALNAGYEYNLDFILQIGTPPNNVPITIGLAWGTLLLTVQKLSGRFNFPLLIRILFEAVFVVSTDIFTDVLVIRLDGGFWDWTGYTVDYSITNASFFGVLWMNYLGWFFVIFYLSLFLNLFNQKIKNKSWKWYIIKIFTIPLIGYIALLSTLLLIVISLPDYTWVVFIVIYIISIMIPLIFFLRKRPEIEKTRSLYPLVYYLNCYLFAIFGMISINLVSEVLWFFILCLLLFGITMYLIASVTDFKNLTWDAI